MKNIKISLPYGFLDEEVRSGYTVSTEIKKVWAVDLDLLCEFSRVCEKYGLKYYADGGTLLGALRHNGFIPWDDDIDVVMMREDYDKLCKVANDEFKPPYFFQTSGNDNLCFFHHAKLRNSNTAAITMSEIDWNYNQGIWIDILPLDNIPDNADELSQFLQKLNKIQGKIGIWRNWILQYMHKKEQGAIPFLRHFIKHIYCKYIWRYFNPIESICTEFDSSIASYKDHPSTLVANLSMLWYVEPRRLFWQRKWYDGARFESFEFLRLPVPFNSEEIMGMQYGDWHKMVQGASCHPSKIYNTERPYYELIDEILEK